MAILSSHPLTLALLVACFCLSTTHTDQILAFFDTQKLYFFCCCSYIADIPLGLASKLNLLTLNTTFKH